LDKAPIKILNLSHNNIGDEGAKYLAEVLKVKRTLIQLHLNDNRISDRGVQLLANALCDAKTNLTNLYLHNNRLISNLSVGYLTNMLNQNRSLNTLWLIDCNLTNADKQQLKTAVASKRNFHLIVDPSD
jgi:Ran GTPase-activating protein (RanGAP) involved in mRNA processing and transport